MNITKAKQVLHLALPLILQQLCLQMQVWIDRAMLGHLNPDFFSAIGNAGTPYYMVLSAITAVCGASAILVAQGIGAQNLSRVQAIAGASILGSGILSVIVFFCFYFGTDGLFHLMGVQSPILEYSTIYIRILSFSLLFLGPSATATAILQGIGFTNVIMATGIAGNFLNILLDWLLIFGKWGFPALGIEGAALATVISNLFSSCLAIYYVLRSPRMPFRPDLRGSPIRLLGSYRRVLQLGIPSALEYALWNAGNLILVSYLNRVDMMAAGIYTLVFSIETIPLLIYMGFANAGLTLVGQQIGARDSRQATRTGLVCLGLSLAVCMLMAVLFQLLPHQILELFTDDHAIVTTAVPYLAFISWILFPKAVNNVIGLCIRGMGDTRWMLYTQVFGTAFMVLGGYCFILHWKFGLSGIFITLLCDESIRSIANLVRFFAVPQYEKLQQQIT